MNPSGTVSSGETPATGTTEDGAAITTLNFSADAPIRVLHGGVGLNIVKDNIAQYSNLGLQASYAYSTDLGNGQLGLGLSFGMIQSKVNGTDFKPGDINDPAIPKGDVSGSNKQAVLKELGSTEAMIVHGEDGLDEISLSSPTYISEL